MATIEAQIELEQELLQKTAERFNANTSKAESSGRGAETDASRRLYKLFVTDLTELLTETLDLKEGRPGVGGKYYALIRRIDPELAVGIGLNELFNNVFHPTKGLQDAFIQIGRRVEDEIKFDKFRQECPDYYDVVIKDFRTRGTTNYRHMHRVLTNRMNEFNISWQDWTTLERVNVGEIIGKTIIEGSDLFEIVKSVQRGKRSDPVKLKFSEDTADWIERYKEHAQFLRPLGAPCIIPPKDWESLHRGGFYSPELQSRFPFVRTRHLKHIRDADLSRHMQAVNALQRTAWEINPQVMHFFTWAMQNNVTSVIGLPSSQPMEFPAAPFPNKDKDSFTDAEAEEFLNWKRETARLHTQERKRYSDSLALWRITHMAREYQQYEQFYFVYTADFRGRIYPVTSGLSPQGADYSKGLLRFREGKRLGEDGAYWFLVHGANLLGFDKATYDQRVEYIQSEPMHSQILRSVANPCSLETAKFVGSADKPLQFLAWCLEYADYTRVGVDFVSHIAIGLDGSCNGLQNFSALLLDEVGGIATNVLPSERPQDIYGEVARVTIGRLTGRAKNSCAISNKLLELGIDRKTTKRPVMTLPYGLSKHSAGQYIGDWLFENHRPQYTSYTEFNAAKNLLNDDVWDSIGEVVKAARVGMQWLQDVARLAAKEGKGLCWTSPTGFKVYQYDAKSKVRRVRSALDGVKSYNVREYTDKIDGQALRDGSAPNFIHSMDAAHLVLTVLEANGITSWQMIHDDFGTHAADIPELHRAIRVAFYRMYNSVNRLQLFADEVANQLEAELPPVPAQGNMNIADVLDSEYFFG